MNQLLIYVILAAGLLLVAAAPLQAQVTTATIYGNVTDASGAPLRDAQIEVRNDATGATLAATTNDEGEFTFTFLPVGRYSLAIKATGFKTQNQPNIEVSAGERLRLSYALEVGQVSDTVTITSEPPLVNAATAEQRETFETLQVRELPTLRRDWASLLRVNTGIGGATANLAGGLSINGLPGAGLTVTVDGTDASQNPEHNSLGMFGNFNTIRAVSLEAIGEITVTKGIAPAEIANTLSGNVNIISKGGSNEFHGSAFENYQTGGLNARNQFFTRAPGVPIENPKAIFHQFGGSFGGPILKNKLFFFGVYEGIRQNDFVVLTANVPTQEFRTRALAAVPAYKQWFDLVNLPTDPVAPGAVIGVFRGVGARVAEDNHAVARGDFYLTPANLLTGRYTRGRPGRTSPNANSELNPQTFTGKTEAATVSFTHSRSNFSTESRFGFQSSDIVRLDNIFALEVSGLDLQNFFGMAGEVLATKGKSFSFEQIASTTRGRHSLKFGGIFTRQDQTRSNIEVPAISYCNVDDFLANIPCNSQVTFGLNPYLITTWANGYFVQDDFKIRPNLILNLGLRWDYFSVPREQDGRLFNRDEPNGFGPLRDPDSIYNADRNNFSPRIGFAWTLDQAGRTVVRGGAGMFYSRAPLIATIETVRNALDEPFRVVFNRAEGIARGIRYPVTNAAVLPLVKSPNFDWTGTTINPNFPTPYSMQWTLSVQRQLTNTLAVETAYVGTRGVKLLLNRDMNQVDRVTGVRPRAGFGRFRHFDTSDSSYYHAWQSSLRKRFTNDFSFDVHYTYAQNISYQLGDLYSLSGPQDNNNIRLEKGPAPNDVRHRFVSNFIYELPLSRYLQPSSRGGKLLLDGWQLTGIYQAESGGPFQIGQGGALTNQRVDLIGDPYVTSSGDPLLYLSRTAFALAPVNATPGGAVQARPGTMGRNALRSLGFWNLDLALSKNLSFTERTALQLRVDMFNAFNHTNFLSINTGFGAADAQGRPTNVNFGRFISTRGARTLQLNARFTF